METKSFARRGLHVFLAIVLSLGLMLPIIPAQPKSAYAADGQIDLQEVFNQWVNFPGIPGAGYAAGWQYNASTGGLYTTQNVGFTGYYNPDLMSFTTGTFACDFQSSDGDPWGFAWGIQKEKNSAGQDTYSFYMYEECGHDHWCIARVDEWVPAKDTGMHRGPVYHATIDAADSQYNHTGGKGSVGFSTGEILAHGPLAVKGVRHRVTIKVEKNKVTVSCPTPSLNVVVNTPVKAGSFGPVTASNSSAFYYNLSMEAAEDNGAIKADFQLYDNGEPSYAGLPGDTMTMEDKTWLDPATKATIKNETWTVFDPSGKQIYTGNAPYSGVVAEEGEYRVVLDVLTSQGLKAKKTKYFYVSEASVVTANYVTESGEKLTDTIIYKGREGKPYQTSDLSFNGYVLSGVEGEESGVFQKGPISVTYTYKKLDEDAGGTETESAQPVTARYVDVDTGQALCDPVVYRGSVGDEYSVSALTFPGYTYSHVTEVIDSVTTQSVEMLSTQAASVLSESIETLASGDARANDTSTVKTGNFGFQAKTLTFYYKQDAAAQDSTVLFRFVDEKGATLLPDQLMTGKVGDPATLTIPRITKYNISTVGGAKVDSYSYSTTFDAESKVVEVVYSPITYTASSVMVLYRDPDGNTIKSIVIDGNAGESYTTEPLNLPGYELVETPANQNGTFVAGSVTLVIYQYKSTLNKPTEDGGKINIDTDDDGLPDVNVDTDGDGKPDVNIDTNGDGIPDKNVVTDEEGKPKPIDPEEPEAPTINIDTDGDGVPDVNIDTDGDGKPDVNVIVDDEGKPKPVDPSQIDPTDPPKPTVNIDTDGDGKPDTNIDTDGNGVPDVNVDTDGDGKPDVNIVDKDGDGKPDNIDPDIIKNDPDSITPDVNVVVDDEGNPKPNIVPDPENPVKPDVNVDTDGDGKPDTNIDTTGDGKPDTNIDLDGNGVPDVNVDTDGDGKPDVNIVDKDGDGKPDPIDPNVIKNDPDSVTPDVNVVTDPDGDIVINIEPTDPENPDPSKPTPPAPTVNVDTDGDGKPDVNVDTDGDGKPDVNIVDKDGDDKPDPVDPSKEDPKNPTKPNVNIDTNGDGKPDVNIDTDGDGRPDVNVDTDGDGVPDTNIDTTGDGKPNVNIDTNNDGKPDVNVDTNGDGTPDVNIDTNDDGIPDKNIVEEPVITYTVTTQLKGMTAGATITPSANIVKGETAQVSWAPGEDTYVASVEVDGKRIDTNARDFSFANMSNNHVVVVTLAEIPVIKAQTTAGYYTVTVNKYGATAGLEASDSLVTMKGDSPTVTWSVKPGYAIKSVAIDGAKISQEQIDAGFYTFASISKNHAVDIVVESQTAGASLSPDDLQVTTKIEGGPGTITGGSTIARGENYQVAWQPVIQTTTDRSDPNYAVYEVESVTVNGSQVTGTDNGLELSNIKENKNVVVTLKPVTYDVTILKYGEGSAVPSKTVYKGNHYTEINAIAQADSRITYIEVDGVEKFREASSSSGAGTSSVQGLAAQTIEALAQQAANQSVATVVEAGNKVVIDSKKEETKPETSTPSESKDPTASTDETTNPDTETAPDQGDPSTGSSESDTSDAASATDGTATEGASATESEATDSAVANAAVGETAQQAAQQAEAEALEFVEHNAFALVTGDPQFGAENVAGPVVATGQKRMDMGITDIDKDHVIKVYFAKDGEPAVTPETLPNPVDISTKVEGGPGEITGGGVFNPDELNPTNPPKIEWEVPDGYEPQEVVIYPKDDPDNPIVIKVNPGDTSLDLPQEVIEKIKDATNPDEYVVTLITQKKEEGDTVAPLQRETRAGADIFEITSKLTGGPGNITATTDVVEGDSHTVTWTAGTKDGVQYRVAKVIIDGVEHPELLEAGSYTFADVAANHTIEVVLEPLPVDTAQEGGDDSAAQSGQSDEKSAKQSTTKTGDMTVVALGTLSVIALAALATMIYLRRRKRDC